MESKNGGGALTDQENEEIEQRQSLINQGSELMNEFREKYKDTSGGLYFDHHKEGGVLFIGYTDKDKDRFIADVKNKLDNNKRIRFFKVDNSYFELKRNKME
ncbi:hypothetical protein [Paenibacillus sp. OAS669]|uniref:hypothetical protein n=1 Tax=Paenibacillus sp. OAS669 TaxID=2663821 RepID=UPI00178AFFE2|nr:hypothetical protein [Paenibacillus sp. OAS669]MBE1444245.1 N-dimethylarginine dimethylaminohydrolase [Paenibacillus sp. OAS669]